MSKLFFVTGSSGFIGSHVMERLLKDGHRVRGTVRGDKFAKLQTIYGSNSSVELVQVNDIVKDTFARALEGVDVVVHIASPLAPVGNPNPPDLVKPSVGGIINVLNQAQAANVKKVVYISSIGVPEYIAPKESVSDESTKFPNSFKVYVRAKKEAEAAVWKWVAERGNHNIEVICLNPSFIYGPFATGWAAPEFVSAESRPNFQALASNLFIYHFIHSKGSYPILPLYVDVRDVAKAVVGAGVHDANPPLQQGEQILISSPPLDMEYARRLLLEGRTASQVKGRLLPAAGAPTFDELKGFKVGVDRIKEVTGIHDFEFTKFDDTFLDAVESLLQLEELWKEKGYNVLDHTLPFFE